MKTYISKYGFLNPKEKCALLGWTFHYEPRQIKLTDKEGKIMHKFNAKFAQCIGSFRDEIDTFLNELIDNKKCIGYQLTGWSKLILPDNRNNSNRSDGTMMTSEKKIRKCAADRDFFVDRIKTIQGASLRTLLFHEHQHELDQNGQVMPSKVLFEYLDK